MPVLKWEVDYSVPDWTPPETVVDWGREAADYGEESLQMAEEALEALSPMFGMWGGR